MSNSKASEEESSTKKRNLPSWMTFTDDDAKPSGKKPTGSSTIEESKAHKHNNTPSQGGRQSKGGGGGGNDSNSTSFSKLMEGVVFVLSGFVHPERAALRSQALEMGAEYRPDWSSECTLLICAYSNTPKFRQVEADGGTIVKKDWILECYSQKKLVEIDSYMMHAGKPWRRNSNIVESSSDQKPSPPRKSEKQVKRGPHSKPTAPSSSKARASNPVKQHFSPSKVKGWAIDDLNRTLSWLESREEKPEPSEIKEIAAGGIMICLQDAIDSLEQDQDIRRTVEQWNIVPHAVEELIKLVDGRNSAGNLSKEDICREVKAFKQIYEEELNNINDDDDDSKLKMKRTKDDGKEKGGHRKLDATSGDAVDYDSDETIEMTEEEIELAYNNVASKICK